MGIDLDKGRTWIDAFIAEESDFFQCIILVVAENGLEKFLLIVLAGCHGKKFLNFRCQLCNVPYAVFFPGL